MRSGILLLLVGIILAYLGVSGKYKCFTLFMSCVAGKGNCSCQDSQNVSLLTPQMGSGLPSLPTLPVLGGINAYSS